MSENVANNVAQREMQDLTEGWKNGELDVLFDVYVKIPDEGVRNRKIYYLNQYLGTKLSDEIEIFAAVPDYDHFVDLTEKANQFPQLAKKVEELEKQLKEANKVIKFYSDAHQLTEEEKQMTAEKYHLVYGLKAIEHLEKWELR